MVANEPTSTGDGGTAIDSVAINCPDLSISHTILVQGQMEMGISCFKRGNAVGGNYCSTATNAGTRELENPTGNQSTIGGILMESTSVAVSTQISQPVKLWCLSRQLLLPGFARE